MNWREKMTERGWRAVARAHATRREADAAGAEPVHPGEWGVRRTPSPLQVIKDDRADSEAGAWRDPT